ncbi:MAG: zinc-ribbon domain containing protein [Chloroflexi bacterium]|nr:zinc-ribbon domain containing protein [Chloroflexota bacterium]MCL5946634.1 zinc-ribbon domain containing protein [Chloroflexota bacterium]
MSYSDITLVCRDCNSRFLFTAGEQQYYATHGLTHQPSRCPSCRAQRKSQQGYGNSQFGSREPSAGPRAPREMHQVVCSTCGRETEVPFAPTPGKPVYCRDCWEEKRGSRSYGAPAGYRSDTRF